MSSFLDAAAITVFASASIISIGLTVVVLLVLLYSPNPVFLILCAAYAGWYWWSHQYRFLQGRPLLPLGSLDWLIGPWAEASGRYLQLRSVYPDDGMIHINPDRPVFMGFHPHGILSLGTLTFLTSPRERALLAARAGLERVRIEMVTIKACFLIPLFRELLSSCGFMESAEEAIKRAISTRNCSNECRFFGFVIGGAEEALYAHPGTMRLILKCRRGFFRLALQYGATVVPVLAVGETDLYDTVVFTGGKSKSSLFNTFQSTCKSLLGCVLPVFSGTVWGIGGSWPFSFLPHQRQPVRMLVGRPLVQESKISEPTAEQINELRDRYIQSLVQLWREDAPSHLSYPLPQMEFVR